MFCSLLACPPSVDFYSLPKVAATIVQTYTKSWSSKDINTDGDNARYIQYSYSHYYHSQNQVSIYLTLRSRHIHSLVITICTTKSQRNRSKSAHPSAQ